MTDGDHTEISRGKQKIAGIFLLLLSTGFIVWTWWTALYKGYYYLKASLIFPMFFVLGVGVLLFPDYKTERINRGEDVSQLEGMKLLTTRWWIILGCAFLAGLVNLLLINLV